MAKLVKPITWIFGVVFIAIGILGFVNNPIVGLFQVDNIHNIIHLASGLVALAAAATSYQNSRLYLMVFGIVYGLVTVLGFLSPDGNILNLITVNTADNFLHLTITIVTLVVGFGSPKATTV